MEHYLVVKKATIQANGKEYRKDKIITADDVGEANIARLLKKGYIRLLGTDSDVPTAAYDESSGNDKLPFYLTADDYLTPEQINKLLKAQLVEYAGHIGLTGFKSNIGSAELKKLINSFIEEAAADDDSEEGPEDEDLPENE